MGAMKGLAYQAAIDEDNAQFNRGDTEWFAQQDADTAWIEQQEAENEARRNIAGEWAGAQ